jgi:hypothetical protein
MENGLTAVLLVGCNALSGRRTLIAVPKDDARLADLQLSCPRFEELLNASSFAKSRTSHK